MRLDMRLTKVRMAQTLRWIGLATSGAVDQRASENSDVHSLARFEAAARPTAGYRRSVKRSANP